MKIHGFRKDIQNSRPRVSASVAWEDSGFPERQIYFETDAKFAGDLSCNPNAFLLAAVIPALHHGERRVLVDGVLCPQLRNGLTIALQLIRNWYGHAKERPFVIEAAQGFGPPLPRQPQRVASFLSGGVDSLATLYSNRLDFPLIHPGSIQDCFFVHGFDIGGYEHLDRNQEAFDLALGSLRTFAQSAQVALIPVSTNLRYLEGPGALPENNFIFSKESHGAALAAVAHAFSPRITRALIASTNTIPDLAPLGSHPLLDPSYSTAALSIRHDGARFSRSEKLTLLSKWDPALRTIRACVNPPQTSQSMNCGQCEKCLRTMTALLTAGKLQDCPSYPFDDISPGQLRSLNVRFHHVQKSAPFALITPKVAHFWRDLLPGLQQIGRGDLVEVIEAKLAEQEEYAAQIRKRNRAHELDRKYLGGFLSKMNRLRRSRRR